MILDLSDSARIPPKALGLGLAGVTPAWILAVLSFGAHGYIRPSLAITAAVAYGALAIAFLGGVRWGLAIGPYGALGQDRAFTLAALAPVAGFAAIFLPPAVGVSLLMAALLLQALWDAAGAEAGRLPHWFGRLNVLVTALIVVPLLAILGRLVLTAMP